MTTKEATVFIVDVGQSMGETREGREVSDLDWALEYVWDKIAAIVCLYFDIALMTRPLTRACR